MKLSADRASQWLSHVLQRYAKYTVRSPLRVIGILLVMLLFSLWGTTRLRINSNQLDLISQDFREVKDVKRIIDMVGGSGYLMLAMRSEQADLMKKVADDLVQKMHEDHSNVRFVVHRIPVDFIQKNIGLFLKTEDLLETKDKLLHYVREKIRRQNPFFVELTGSQEAELDFKALKEKYSHMGKKTILDEYYISDDGEMLLLLIKPMWDSNELSKTKDYLKKLNADISAYNSNNAYGATLFEDYKQTGNHNKIAYGYTGSYKTSLDDSFAIANSLEPVSSFAFAGITLITFFFFRKIIPSLVVLSGVVVATLFCMGFTYLTVGSLNMITSILGGIMMGFGVDYGIHFVFRSRIELAQQKDVLQALENAFIHAGRPAFVSAIVTGGSFLVLLVSDFKGFSQFGFLAGFGILIISLTMFTWCASCLSFLAQHFPQQIRNLIGHMDKHLSGKYLAEDWRIPHPKQLLVILTLVVVSVCAWAIPWDPVPLAYNQKGDLWQRFRTGIRFNYNTRALMPEDQYSVQLQDEINRRFQISSDPVAIYTKTLEETKNVYDSLQQHPELFPSTDQVVSIYNFVPDPQTAVINANILQSIQEAFNNMQVHKDLFPKELQPYYDILQTSLSAKPYGVEDVPEIYANQFRNLPSSKLENQGFLTFVYPRIDLWDGVQLLHFADEIDSIHTADGKTYHGAGLPLLYAKLARIVLADGQLTVWLTIIWILFMHFIDFRSIPLALISVIPLGVGLVMMLGIMSMTGHPLNFMNIITLPMLLGFGVSHGLYLLHRFLEGTSPIVALRSVGAAVLSSTLTTVAGFAALFAASHNGLQSIGYVSCIGLITTLMVSFTVLAAVLQIIYNKKNPIKPKGSI